jgi:molybdopterin molybdotransferase
MISFEQAFEIVLGRAQLLGTESVPLREAAGRVLAQNVFCDIDMPPFDKSAMDGYACRRADLPGPLHVVETIQAGSAPTKTVGTGDCAKIMTGAMLPQGADCVIMVEHTETDRDGQVRFLRENTSANICFRGEDLHAGDLVAHKGTLLAPRHIAVLAMAGCAQPVVARRPRVGILATGDELVEPDTKPGPSQIRTSNSFQICAQVEQTGAIATYYGIVADTEAALDAAMKRGMAENDVLLLSGGVSMGDFDLVPGMMVKNGLEILFDSIAMKPGKPTTFAVGPSCSCFGLPGNPVSTFVQCEILVKPFLYALMGHPYRAAHSCLPLAETYRRKKTDREAWVPVEVASDGGVRTAEFHGSAHISALSAADGLIVVPQGCSEIGKGTLVRVRSI